jgi:hypothetical protein
MYLMIPPNVALKRRVCFVKNLYICCHFLVIIIQSKIKNMKKILPMLMMILSMVIIRTQAQVIVLSESFESGIPSGWTVLDVDNDGNTWTPSTPTDDPFFGGYTDDGYVFSNDNPNVNNWLITPAITLGSNSSLSFYRSVTFFQYAEHYGIYVSTTTTDPSAFTQVFEETCSRDDYSWQLRTYNLSAYDGNTIYIAFRHFNSNIYKLALDDITVTTSTANSTITATPTEVNFGAVPMGSPTPVQQVYVSGYNITNGINASVNSPFEISSNNIDFDLSISLPDTGGIVYVRYYPSMVGVDNSLLTLTGNTTTQTVALSGTSLDCSTTTLPYNQDFDSTSQGFIPSCWYKINPYEGYPQVLPNNDHSGMEMLFRSNRNTEEPIFAVMPEMPLDLSNLQMSFWTRREGSYSGTFSVGYVTDPSDSSTFVPLWSRTAAEMGDNNYQPFIINLSNVNTSIYTNYYIAFKYQANEDWYWYLDNITVEESPSCGTPFDLTVLQVTTNSATLSWTGNVDNYTVYYRRVDETAWTSIPDVALDMEGYILENLLPATNYVWYVAADCGEDSLVNSLATSTFTTACDVYTSPFFEDFNAQYSLPNCWEKMEGLASDAFTGTNPTPSTTSSTGWTTSTTPFGNRHPKLNIYGENTKYWLVTPSIDLSSLTNPALTFDLALTKFASSNPILNPTAQADDKFMVIISTDDGANWSAANATIWSDDTTMSNRAFSQIATTGQEVTISLAAYVNQTVKIAFYGESTVDGGDNDLHIDNVTIAEAVSCAQPTNLTVIENDTSVTLAWTEHGSASSWNIQYGTVGFTLGDDEADTVLATTNPFTINNLTTNATYDFYIQSNCDDEHSLWEGPITATPGSFSMATSGMDTITTCSLVIYDNGGVNGNYSNNSNSILILYPETEDRLVSVTGNYDIESTHDYLYIFDGVGTSGAMLNSFSGIGTIAGIVSSSGPLTILFTSDGTIAKSGYALNVSCFSCASPTGLTVDNITHNSAEILWNDNDAINSWLLEYKAVNDTIWTAQTTSDTIVFLNNLDMYTNYEVRVSANCGENEYSMPTVTTFSTTMAAVNIPYSTDFSEDDDRNWIFNNGSCGNYWTIGSLGTESAMFITNNGTTAGYTINSTFSIVSVEKLFTIGETDEFAISFDAKIGGESIFDYLKVFFSPADVDYPASTSVQNYADYDYSSHSINFPTSISEYPYMINLTDNNTVHVAVSVPNPNTNPTSSSTAKLVFLWKNDHSGGTQPGAIITNVSVEAIYCPMPANLTVNNVTTNSAEVTWTATGSETAWNLKYKAASDTTWTFVSITTPSYSLTNLEEGTEYEVHVQADCNTDQSLWLMGSFTTFCDAVTTFPYTEGFENSGDMANCWTQEYVTGVIDWTVHSGNFSSIIVAHSGTYNAYFYNESHDNFTTKLVSPIFDFSNVTNPCLTYWYSQASINNGFDKLKVYYRTSPSAEWQLLSSHATPVMSWTKDSLMLPNPSATYQVAFEGLASQGYGITVDDITIAEASFVPVITNPTVTTAPVTDIEQTTATANATITNPDNVNITGRGFQLTTVSTGSETEIIATGSGNNFAAELTNLTAATDYAVKAFITFNDTTVYGNIVTFTTAENTDGINDHLLNSISLYPNPANKYVDIHIDGTYTVRSMEVYDVYGHLINTINIIENPCRINISDMANGMYFVRVITEKGIVTKPFVKK